MKSRVYNKSILDWQSFPETDAIWCDPPWGTGYIKFFNNLMIKQTGKSSDHTLSQILNHLGALAPKNKPLIVEYSVKEADQVIAFMKKHGHRHCRTITGIYGNKLPFVMTVFNCDIDMGEDGFRDEHYLKILRAKGIKSVFDPFAGIGHTAKICIKNDITYIGSEINSQRYLRCAEVVAKMEEKRKK